MTKADPPLRNCACLPGLGLCNGRQVKKINDAWLHATKRIPKEICLSPISAGEFISFYQNAELIFSNLSAAAAFFLPANSRSLHGRRG